MKKHWNFTYFVNRVKAYIYWKLNQDKPWLTKDANEYLNQNLNDQMIGLEFGSGRSTLFFAKKLMNLVSVEDNQGWYLNVKILLEKHNINNVDYRLLPVDDNTPNKSDYYKIIEKFKSDYFDFILVDGKNRDLCALSAIHELKSKGLLVIDNVNWFLPSDSISPASVAKNEPPINENWSEVYKNVSNWEKIWTSNGVTDTAIFIKP